jgi:hypothetical protein
MIGSTKIYKFSINGGLINKIYERILNGPIDVAVKPTNNACYQIGSINNLKVLDDTLSAASSIDDHSFQRVSVDSSGNLVFVYTNDEVYSYVDDREFSPFSR